LAGILILFSFTLAGCPEPESKPDPGSTAVTVTGVTVSPKTSNVVKGGSQQFTATVTGENNPAQTITWTIETAGKNAGTAIDREGKLTVAAAETLTSLVVKATSTADTNKSDTATVGIHNQSMLPTVTSVTVSPPSASVAKGRNQTFTATVTGTNNPAQTVTWSIVQPNKNSGTTIDSSGSLSVAAAETLTSLTIRATSTVDTTKYGTAAVTIPTSTSPPTIATPLHSKWPFYVGAAAPSSAFNTSNGQYSLLGHFNVLVAENDMKPESFMPQQWQNWQSSPTYNASQAYRWTEADKLVNYAEANNTKIRGHVLFWHEQTPGVFFRTGNLTSAYVTKDVLYTRMEQHVKTVFQKYRGRIQWWEVANECVGDDGNPRVTGGANVAGSDGKSGFTAVMEASGVTGDDRYEWVVNAFKYARKHADENGGQNVKLFLAEYNIENGRDSIKRDGFLRLLDYLITKGAPVDGVGIQGHTRVQDSSGYVSSLGSLIDQIATRTNPVSGKKLVVQVTELDISLFAWGDPNLTLSSSELNTRLQTQAAMYRGLFDMFAEKHSDEKFEMVLVWGLGDGHSWLNGFPTDGRVDHPLLFDRQYQPKSAFNSLITGPGNVNVDLNVPNPNFTGWGGLGGVTGSTFAMVKEAANTYDCRTTYQFPAEASAYSKFTVSYTVTKTADNGNKIKLIFNDRAVDEWGSENTFEDYKDHENNGSYTYTHSLTNKNCFAIAINKYDGSNPTTDFTIVIDSIKFHN
jgi:GH35 family endo-1,4-beta-xylanase